MPVEFVLDIVAGTAAGFPLSISLYRYYILTYHLGGQPMDTSAAAVNTQT
jgi:hypothetical protein